MFLVGLLIIWKKICINFLDLGDWNDFWFRSFKFDISLVNRRLRITSFGSPLYFIVPFSFGCVTSFFTDFSSM